MTWNTTVTTQTRLTTNAHDLDALARRAPATDDLIQLADWLATNSAVHLSAIERIELAERLITRRRFLIGAGGLLGAATLGACGAGEQEAAPTPASSGYPRTVQHSLGEVRISSRPERIGCITNGADLQTLIGLGVQPVGVGLVDSTPWVEDRIAASVNTYEIPNQVVNIERVATWEPDVLIGPTGGSWLNEESITTFQEIAPTVSVPFSNWRESLRIVSETVGMEMEATRLREETERLMTDLGERLGSRISWRLVILASYADDSIYIMTTESPVNEVLTAAGVPSLYPANTAGDVITPISFEVLPDIEADAILLLSFEGRDGTVYTDQSRLLENDIFQLHPAVQAGRVLNLDPTESLLAYYSTVMTIPLIVEMLAERITELPA